MKRIAVGQIMQETNTLNPAPTRRIDFETYGLARGAEVMERYGQVGELAGFEKLPEVLEEEVEWVGLIRALAWPRGPLEGHLLDELVEGATAPLRDTQVDGVIISLHGAQSAATHPDLTGRVLEEMRRILGPDIPLVSTLDLHANITRSMVRHADVLVGYHTAPHIDHASCGERAARVLVQLLKTGERPRLSMWKAPMLMTDSRPTDSGVLQGLWQRIVAAEARSDVLAVGLYMAQPWFDVPELGWTLYQAFLGEEPPLDPEAVLQECWDTRHHRQIHFLRPEEVVGTALQIQGGPVAVSESHDATNSGAPGDSTLLLAELVKAQIPAGGALCFCVDPGAVEQCAKAGIEAEIQLEVGGRLDPYSEPLVLGPRVLDLGEIRFRLSGHAGHNLPVDMGRTALVRAGDVTVVLTEKTGPGSTPRLYEAVGLDPRDYKIVVAKSPEGFRQDYAPFAAGILYCGAPGCATPYLQEVDFQHAPRPLFPLDPLEQMSQADWAGEVEV